mmetsp:Transcript_34686/g.77579  ORF Transcript_34686/g.77579 Transcript_34686/m.77579 type:complete len:1951 (+) Transcript_34686:60-5912(+)
MTGLAQHDRQTQRLRSTHTVELDVPDADAFVMAAEAKKKSYRSLLEKCANQEATGDLARFLKHRKKDVEGKPKTGQDSEFNLVGLLHDWEEGGQIVLAESDEEGSEETHRQQKVGLQNSTIGDVDDIRRLAADCVFAFGPRRNREGLLLAIRCTQVIRAEGPKLFDALENVVAKGGAQLSGAVEKCIDKRSKLGVGTSASFVLLLARGIEDRNPDPSENTGPAKVSLPSLFGGVVVLLALESLSAGSGNWDAKQDALGSMKQAVKVVNMATEEYTEIWGDDTRRGWRREMFCRRLLLEHQLKWALLRLMTLLLLFVTLWYSLEITQVKRHSINMQETIAAAFNLHQVEEISTIAALLAFLRQVSSAGEQFSPLSQYYLGGDAAVQIHRDFQSFDEEQRAEGFVAFVNGEQAALSVPIKQEFSFSSWVQIGSSTIKTAKGDNDQFIIRRRLGATGASAELTCWGVKANAQLVFGAHDYGGDAGTQETFPQLNESEPLTNANGVRWEDVLPGNANPDFAEQSAQRTLVAVSVSGKEVEFFVAGGSATVVCGDPYEDCVVASSKDFNNGKAFTLERAITDCDSPLLTFGDKGISLGDLRYFPRALSRAEVRVIHSQGASDSDLGNQVSLGGFQSDGLAQLQSEQRDATARVISEVHQIFQTSTAVDIALGARADTTASEASLPVSDSELVSSGKQGDDLVGGEFYGLLAGPVAVVPPDDGGLRSTWSPAVEASTNGSTYSLYVQYKGGDGFVIARGKDNSGSDSMCWGLFVTANQVQWWMHAFANGETQPWQYSFLSEPVQWSGRQWRHLAVVIDPVGLPRGPLGEPCVEGEACGVHLFLDGHELLGDWSDSPGDGHGYPVEDCPPDVGNSMLFLGHRPPGAWDSTVNVREVKFYQRTMSNAEVFLVADQTRVPEHNGSTLREAEGCRFSNELRDANGWKDAVGYGCSWYQLQRSTGVSNVCQDAIPAAACPLACGSVDQCYEPSVTAVSTKLWRRIMLLDPLAVPEGDSSAGRTRSVVCTRDDADEDLVNNDLWSTLNPPESAGAPAQPMRIDPTCSEGFGGPEMDAFAEQYSQTQEFTIHFWVKSTDSNPAGFFPEINFWRRLPEDRRNQSDLGFPSGKPHIAFQSKSYIPNGLAPFLHLPFSDTECSADKVSEAADVLPFTFPQQEWVFVAMARDKNNMVRTVVNAQWAEEQHPVAVSTGRTGVDCLPGFIDALSVNGKMLLSPVTLVARAQTVGELQSLFYKERPIMQVRTGPLYTDAHRVSQTQPRPRKKYTHRTMILAPPMIAQSIRPRAPCRSDAEDEVLNILMQKARAARCPEGGFYSCDFLDDPSFDLFYCSDPAGHDPVQHVSRDLKCSNPGTTAPECYFGKQPNFEGYYTEYLRTIMDYDYVVRDKAWETEEFVTERTEQVLLSMVFHSLEFGLTTLVEISAEVGEAKVGAEYDIKHYFGIEGSRKFWFVLTQVCFILLTLSLIAGSVHGFTVVKELQKGALQVIKSKSPVALADSLMKILSCFDAMLGVALLVLSSLLMEEAHQSKDAQAEMVHTIVGIQWGFGDAKDNEQLAQETLEQMRGRIGHVLGLKKFGLAVLLILALRCLAATHTHPRIALLVETLKVGADDLWHFMVVFLPMMVCYAGIGSWRYGNEMSNMRTTMIALVTMWEALLDPPGELSGSESWEFAFFAFVFFVVALFFFLNFVLAIIVNSYVQVVEKQQQDPVDMNFAWDVYKIVSYNFHRVNNKWPGPRQVRDYVEDHMLGRSTIDVDELWKTEVFIAKGATNLEAYKSHYDMKFLQPNHVHVKHQSPCQIHGDVIQSELLHIKEAVHSLVGHRRPGHDKSALGASGVSTTMAGSRLVASQLAAKAMVEGRAHSHVASPRQVEQKEAVSPPVAVGDPASQNSKDCQMKDYAGEAWVAPAQAPSERGPTAAGNGQEPANDISGNGTVLDEAAPGVATS